jgi:isoleucyl-tRNA synthetase
VRELEHKLAAVTSSKNNLVQLTEKLEQQLSNKFMNAPVSTHVSPEIYDLELGRYKSKVHLLTNILSCYRDSLQRDTTSSVQQQELVQLRNAYDTEVKILENEMQVLQSQLDMKSKHIHELRVRFEDAYKYSSKPFNSSKESLLLKQLEDTRRMLESKEHEVTHLSSKMYTESRKQSNNRFEDKENTGNNTLSSHRSKLGNSEPMSTIYHVGNGFLRVKK